MPNFDPSREELEHVSGDLPDDPGQGRLGLFDLTKNAYHVRVRYKNTMIFCEVYPLPGEPLMVHWACPRCSGLNMKRMTRLLGARTKIEYDPHSQVEDGGRLNIAHFECPWELESSGPRRQFGVGMCKLELVVDNNWAREDRREQRNR